MLEVLKVLKAHGIDGSVCVFVINPINPNKPLYDTNGEVFKIERFNSTRKILKFESVSDRNTSENLKGLILYQKKEKLKENEFYVSDLIGRKLKINGSDEYCEITDIVNYGAGEIAEIRYKEKELLIPFRKEYFRDDLSINLELINKFY